MAGSLEAADAARLKRIQERCHLASAGPWGFAHTLMGGEPDFNRRQLYNKRSSLDLYMNYHMGTWTEQHKADAAFIAESRVDVPYLLGLITQLSGGDDADA